LRNYYSSSLENLVSNSTFQLPNINTNTDSNNHTFFITVQDSKNTNKLIQLLTNNGIAAVNHFYPLHQSKFHSPNQNSKDFPNATNFNNTLIRLPLHHYLTLKEIDFIVEKINDYFSQN